MEHLATRQFHAGSSDHAREVVAALEDLGWSDVAAHGPQVTWPGSPESVREVAALSYALGQRTPVGAA